MLDKDLIKNIINKYKTKNKNGVLYYREVLLQYINDYYSFSLPNVIKNNVVIDLIPNNIDIDLFCIEYSNNSIKMMLGENTINVSNYINKKYKKYLAI